MHFLCKKKNKKTEKNKPVWGPGEDAAGGRKGKKKQDINKHQTTMRFTCLIINFLQVCTFRRGPALERRERGGKRARGTRAEGRVSARNTSGVLPNTKTGLSLVFLYPLILFPLLRELVQNFRGGCNEHIKARRQIAAQRTHSMWALISLLKMEKRQPQSGGK